MHKVGSWHNVNNKCAIGLAYLIVNINCLSFLLWLSLSLCVGFELLIVKQNLGSFLLIILDLDNLYIYILIKRYETYGDKCSRIYMNLVGTSKNVYLFFFFFLEAIILYLICYSCGWSNDYYYWKQWTITSETNNAYYYIKFTSLTIRSNQELGHSLGPPSLKHLY